MGIKENRLEFGNGTTNIKEEDKPIDAFDPTKSKQQSNHD
jgi:hypothetical protein